MDLTPLFNAIIALISAVITLFVVPWIKSKTTAQQRERMIALAEIGVKAAEQIYGAGKGQEKLLYVANYLKSHGIQLNTEQLEALIESAVYNMNKQLSAKDKSIT